MYCLFFVDDGLGVMAISNKLDLSNNYIKDMDYLMTSELGNLRCAGSLNLEHNAIEVIENTTIKELAAKWSRCGSSL